MVIYISLLRGVNVGGQKRIKMIELIALYESLGFTNIKTYLQSGNVIFSSAKDNKRLSNLLEEKIKQVFGFPVAVLLRTPTELQHIITHNPFLKENAIDTNQLYVTFLSGAPTEAALSKTKEIQDELDEFIITSKEIYLYCPNGYGRTKFSNDFFERKLGIATTTRNWQTVESLFELSKKQTG
jgi:uncharacterized protein (DUF1697 family)